jgi:hypothetical protein
VVLSDPYATERWKLAPKGASSGGDGEHAEAYPTSALGAPDDLSLGRPEGAPGEADFTDGPSNASVMPRQANGTVGVMLPSPNYDDPSDGGQIGPALVAPHHGARFPEPLRAHEDFALGHPGWSFSWGTPVSPMVRAMSP